MLAAFCSQFWFLPPQKDEKEQNLALFSYMQIALGETQKQLVNELFINSEWTACDEATVS